jgi:hypothetical protein
MNRQLLRRLDTGSFSLYGIAIADNILESADIRKSIAAIAV